MARLSAILPLVSLLCWVPVAPAVGKRYNYSLVGTDWPGLCQSGEFQSPISIDTRAADPVSHSLEFFPQVGESFSLINSGTNVNVIPDPKANNSLLFDGQQFSLLQLHAHAYSEHAWDGSFAAMELHLVHTKASNSSQLLVVAVPLRLDFGSGTDRDNAFLKQWLGHAPDHEASITIKRPLDFYSNLQLPGKRAIKTLYTYPGSLTTPACTQGVTWVVLDPGVSPTVSVSQLEAFEVLISRTSHGVPSSNRPPRPLFGRRPHKFLASL